MKVFGVLLAVMLLPAIASAQTDEIQVYNGELADVGKFNLTWHQNFTPKGAKEPSFPGGLVSNHAYVGVPEWAYGVTKFFELGLYMPLYSVTSNQGATLNGFKLRTLFAVPKAEERTFFYGVNFEFSWNQRVWDTQVNTGEVRPIIGWRFGDERRWSFTFNPIDDNSYKGFSRLEFVPATRLDYKVNDTWTVAAEEYDDFGQLRAFLPAREQFHQLWAVADYSGDPVSIEAGVGFGLTPSTDSLAVKLMLSSDLTGPHGLLSR